MQPSPPTNPNPSQPPPPPGQQKGPAILTPELIQSVRHIHTSLAHVLSAPSSSSPAPPPFPSSHATSHCLTFLPLAPLSLAVRVQYLDQNQLFISAIVENQSLGKLAAAMEYQIKLQQNLLFLSSLADQPTQPPPQQSPPSHTQQSSK